jgi:hypothetical protein
VAQGRARTVDQDGVLRRRLRRARRLHRIGIAILVVLVIIRFRLLLSGSV